MDFGNMVGEAFGYAKEGLVGKWKKWILLLIATILLTLPLMGYTLRILRGEKPAPEVENWGTLFIDGIKYLIIGLIYAIPLFIIMFLALAPVVVAAMSAGSPEAMTAIVTAALGTFLVGLVVFIIAAIIIGLFANIGIVRFARMGSMGEAFNFGAILATIGKIGWINYIVALIIMGIILGIVEFICNIIPYVGIIILFIIIPYLTMIQARYICLIYDSAGTA
nr:DUF4013 domain-containing protein [uncultured Methanoregula sp.]